MFLYQDQLPDIEDLLAAQADPSSVEDPAQWDGLVGWWPFPQGSVQDFSGRNNHGTRAGAGGSQNLPQWTSTGGRLWLPTGMNFDGTDDYVSSTGSDLGFLATNAFTLCCWIKTTTGNASDGVFGKYKEAAPAVGYTLAFVNGKLYCLLRSNGATAYKYRLSDAAVNDGTWHHIAFTNSGSATLAGITAWIDGAVAASTTAEAGTLGSIATTEPFCIGSRATTGLLCPCSIADARAYGAVANVRRIYEDGGAIARQRRRTWFVPTSTPPEPSGYRHWLRRRNAIIGGGLI